MNSLSQTVLKVCMPGVPDFYRGTELWDFNLVDPDNRRPVDYERRRKSLHELASEYNDDPEALVNILGRSWPETKLKLFIIWRLLRLRRERQEMFMLGNYLPLEVRGTLSAHVIAFARAHADDAVITIVPRLTKSLLKKRAAMEPEDLAFQIDWQDTAVVLPVEYANRLANAFTNQQLTTDMNRDGEITLLPLQTVMQQLPVAVLSTTI
jgi:(1->4)-alpha-D-glucan 1-alpha-D-glucosylmutase